MAPVKGDISRIGRFQICRHLIPIAVLECVGHQCIAVTLTLMDRIDANAGEVPVRLNRVVLRRLVKYVEDVATSGR
jgi:hypothetical protein